MGQSQALAAAEQPTGHARSEDLDWQKGLCAQRVRTVSWYLPEQESETTDPERHFLEEGGKGLGCGRGKAPALWPGTAHSHGGRGMRQPPLHSPTAHLPGSSIWRLPLLSTTSRGGRGCPVPTSTARKVGMLKDTGHGSASAPGAAQTWPCCQRGTGRGRWGPSTTGSVGTWWLWLRLSQGWYKPVPRL